MSATIRDFTNPTWGHNISLMTKHDEKGSHWSIAGWAEQMHEGDIVLLKGPSGGKSPYRVAKLRWCGNPDDMFFADLYYATERDLNPPWWLRIWRGIF